MKKNAWHLFQVINKIPYGWFIAVASLLYLALTFTSPVSDHHQLLNLEPYPDGLFYINSAMNIVQKGQFAVTYHGYVIPSIITPLYSYILAIGFLLTTSPGVFYVLNLVLGVISLGLVLLTIRLITKRNWILALGAAIYLSHVILLWLPSVPMAENAILTVFAGAMYGYFRYLKRPSWQNLLLAVALISGLVFSKYTTVGLAGVLGLALLAIMVSRKAWTHLSITIGLFVLAGGLFLFTQMQAGFNPLFLFAAPQQLVSSYQSIPNQPIFYSIRYIVPNAWQYARALLGVLSPAGQFLWLMSPLTTVGLVSVFVIGLGWLFVKGEKQSVLFLLLFLAQFPLLLIFYVVDQRYIILTVPILSIGLSYLLAKCKQKKLLVVLIGLSLGIQVFTQIPVIRILIADNLLQRSTAWQYQAVKSLNTQLPANSYLITVLPPLLVDIYSSHQYALLPLSPHQEFLDKHYPVWGDQIDYSNLTRTYTLLLQQDQTVFITNAYLSSQHEFQTSFDQVVKNFATQKVGEGCLGTCDLYQLKLKPTTLGSKKLFFSNLQQN